MPELECISSSPDETRAIGAAVAGSLAPGDAVSLSGDLGAGKTCLVQGAATALGVTARVQSPSFVLVREYAGTSRIVHVDVYRLNSLQELYDLGYEEVFDPGLVTFVEWGDAVEGALPVDRLEIQMTQQDEERRRIVIRGVGDRWEREWARLSAACTEWMASA